MNSDHNKHGPPAAVCRRNRIIASVRQQTTIPQMVNCQQAIFHFGQSGLSPGTGNSWPEFGVYRRLSINSSSLIIEVKTQDIASQQNEIRRSTDIINPESRIRYPASGKHAQSMEINEDYRP